MGIKTKLGDNTNVGNVEQFINTSYDKVKVVADNIDAILSLEESFSNLDGNYIGTSATEPTQRPDTNPLENGDSYFNTTLNAFYVYIFDTATWVQHQAFYGQAEFESAVGAGPFNVWIAYADDAVGNGISTIPSGKDYIGFANNQTTSVVDTGNVNIFTWYLAKGAQGIQGEPGLDGVGTDGTDGLNGTVDIETPLTPVNVDVKTTASAVQITWGNPAYSGHWYTKVYRTTWDGINFVPFEEGFLYSTTQGDFIDLGVDSVSNYLYWLRHVNLNAVTSGLAGGNGFQAATLESFSDQQDWINPGNMDPALVTRINLIDSQLVNPADGGLVTQIQNVDTSLTALTTTVGTIDSEGTQTATDLTNLSDSHDLLSTVVGDENAGIFYQVGLNTTSGADNSAAIALNLSSIGGLHANFTVKINVNGHIAGIGLLSTTSSDGNVVSEFGVLADKFIVATPGNNEFAPFVIDGSNVYIENAFIKNASIVNAQIANLAVTAAKIADLTVTGAKIANATIADAKITTLSATKLTTGTLDAGRIATNSLNANKIVTSSITATQLATNSVTAVKILAGNVTAAKMAANSITAANGAIANLTVTTLKIANSAVTESTAVEATGNTNIGTSYVDIETLAFVVPSGESWNASINAACILENYNQSTTATVTVRLLRDATVVWGPETLKMYVSGVVQSGAGAGGFTISYIEDMPMSLMDVSSALGVGSYTYKLQALSNASGNVRAKHAAITFTGLKK